MTTAIESPDAAYQQANPKEAQATADFAAQPQKALPEIGQVIDDPEKFVSSGQFLKDVQLEHLPEDFQAKAFVHAEVVRDGSLIHPREFRAGDVFRGWSSGIVVSHKNDRLANEGGLSGVLRNPTMPSLDEAVEKVNLPDRVSLRSEDREEIFQNMEKNAYIGAMDYIDPMESWAKGLELETKPTAGNADLSGIDPFSDQSLSAHEPQVGVDLNQSESPENTDAQNPVDSLSQSDEETLKDNPPAQEAFNTDNASVNNNSEEKLEYGKIDEKNSRQDSSKPLNQNTEKPSEDAGKTPEQRGQNNAIGMSGGMPISPAGGSIGGIFSRARAGFSQRNDNKMQSEMEGSFLEVTRMSAQKSYMDLIQDPDFPLQGNLDAAYLKAHPNLAKKMENCEKSFDLLNSASKEWARKARDNPIMRKETKSRLDAVQDLFQKAKDTIPSDTFRDKLEEMIKSVSEAFRRIFEKLGMSASQSV